MTTHARPRQRSIIEPAISSRGNKANSNTQINKQPEIVSARQAHSSTKERTLLGSSFILCQLQPRNLIVLGGLGGEQIQEENSPQSRRARRGCAEKTKNPTDSYAGWAT
ncbi:MAG: hypothetical protein WAU45_08480 [Blastocatellia bacterium]